MYVELCGIPYNTEVGCENASRFSTRMNTSKTTATNVIINDVGLAEKCILFFSVAKERWKMHNKTIYAA